MLRKRLFYDNVSFTADTDDIQIIQPRYIHAINVSMRMLQNGATAPTFADMLSVLDKMQVKLTGKTVTELSAQDILALNCLVQNRSIKFIVPSADNEYGYVEGLSVPLALPAGEHILSVRFLHNSVSTIDTEKLSFSTLESDEPIEEKHYEFPTFNFTPPSTGAYNTALDVKYTAEVHGFLIYSTTIPTASATTTTVAKLRMKVEGDIVYEDNWHGLSSQTFYPEDSTLRGILDNYVFLNFSKAPIEPEKRVELEIYSDDTNAVKIIPILRV